MRSSMVLITSGKPCRKFAAPCLAGSACPAAKSSSAASRSPVWFQSSSCSLRTTALFSSADIFVSSFLRSAFPWRTTTHGAWCHSKISGAPWRYPQPRDPRGSGGRSGIATPSSGWKPVGHSLGAATSVRRYRNLQRRSSPLCARTSPSSPLLRAGPLPCPLLPDAARERVAEHELPIRYGCRRRCNLLGALLCDLLVGDSLGELTDPKPTRVPGGAVGRQDVVGSYGLVRVGHCRVFPEKKRTVVSQAFEEPVGVFGLHL